MSYLSVKLPQHDFHFLRKDTDAYTLLGHKQVLKFWPTIFIKAFELALVVSAPTPFCDAIGPRLLVKSIRVSSSGSSRTSDLRRSTRSRNCCFKREGYPPSE
uniref:Uncharacterized protein n=1 Tax=Meloidogyne incognita TaxID=6306 RepID=A0A914NZ83_MELIC